MKFNCSDLTNEEKSMLLQGTDFMYTHAVKRLGIPRLSMADGPHGVRKQIGGGDNGVAKSEPATAFPTAAAVASSWNPENAKKIGMAIGKECHFYGVNMILGPGLNIKRNPLCGRNFEYYSEDPLVSGTFGAAFIQGVQATGVSACVKHFALNNQENFRFNGNSVADERAMREIYLKSFEIAVKNGKPGAVMSSYNRINGVFASENKWLLTDVLRNEWGFDGIVMSDWGGTHDRIQGICAGEDLEMPGGGAYTLKQVYDSLENGTLNRNFADSCINRLLSAVDRFVHDFPKDEIDIESHSLLSADIATDSAVLMKNDGVLPLSKNETFCVIGELFEKMRYQGSGSSMITPTKVISHKDAFDKREINYEYARGYSTGYDENDVELFIEAVKLSKQYKTIVLYLGLTDIAESEGGDRENMHLPKNQLRLVSALKQLKKRIVVVLSGGSPVELPFANDVNAILNLYLPGQCGGEAGARLLFGEATPSGKLSETWYKTYNDVPYGTQYSIKEHELYKESVFVGYRYAKTAKVPPAFPFGFGLSYTTFSLSDFKVTQDNETISVTLKIRNSGIFDGAEVVQLYVKNNVDSCVFKPISELRAFKKVFLKSNEEKPVTLSFKLEDLSFWNTKTNTFCLENGTYTAEIGTSCQDIIFSQEFNINSANNFDCPYSEEVNLAMSNAKLITDSDFSSLLGKPLPQSAPILPLTLETRFCDFQNTFIGNLLYNAVCTMARVRLKKAKKLPTGPLRDNRIKGALFLQRIFDTNCMRTLSLSAGKLLPWNVANGFVHLGNGRIFRGIAAMLKSHKIRKKKK